MSYRVRYGGMTINERVQTTSGVGLKGAQSWCFVFFWPRTKSLLNGRKLEINSLLRKKNIREIIINHKGTRMVKDGED